MKMYDNAMSYAKAICHTLISFGDYNSLMFSFSLAKQLCSTPVTAQNKRSFSVLIQTAKDTKKGGQKGFFLEFPGPCLA